MIPAICPKFEGLGQGRIQKGYSLGGAHPLGGGGGGTVMLGLFLVFVKPIFWEV